MEGKKFVTAINCIDGRVQTCVTEWLKEQYQADFVDMITEPGADKVMAEGPADVIELIRKNTMVSVGSHHSNLIAIVGHYDCAANPVTYEEHLVQIKKGIEKVKKWNLPLEIIGLWVGDSWTVSAI